MAGFPVNAVLVFQVSTGDTEIDELGNPRAIVQPLTVRCFLKEARNLPRPSTGDAASDRHELTLEGRCVEPKALPPTLMPGSIATIQIDGRTGTFELLPTAQTAFSQVTAKLGEKIRGVYSVRVQWGGADV